MTKRNTKRLKSFDDFLEMMKASSITDARGLRHEYPQEYRRYVFLKIQGKIGEKSMLPGEKALYQVDISMDDVQNYIYNNNIASKKSLMIKNFQLYMSAVVTGIDMSSISFCDEGVDNQLVSLKDFQDFIYKHSIANPSDFIARFRKEYASLIDLDYHELVEYTDRHRSVRNHELDDMTFDTIESLQEFVNDFGVISISDLQINFSKVYKSYVALKNIDPIKNTLVFPYSSIDATSSKERAFCKLLFKYRVRFFPQFTFPNVIKAEKVYRYDFLLAGYYTGDNEEYIELSSPIIVEVHGTQHFEETRGNLFSERLEDVVENDKKKKQLAESMGVKVRYFTLEKSVYDKRGYYDKVYTDGEELLREVGIPTNSYDVNYLKKFSDYYSLDSLRDRLVSELNQYIIDNDIHSSSQLERQNQSLYTRVLKSGGLKFVNYVMGDFDTRKFLSKEDIGSFILDNKIRGPKWFKLVDNKLYGKSSKRGWLNGLTYYNLDDFDETKYSDIVYINNYIDTNKISSIDELNLFSPSLVEHLTRDNLDKSIEFYKDPIYEEAKKYRDVDSISSFIMENKISSPIELIGRNRLIYKTVLRKKLKIKYYQDKDCINVRAIKSENEVNDLLRKYSIHNKTEFRSWNLELYLKSRRCGWNLTYKE